MLIVVFFSQQEWIDCGHSVVAKIHRTHIGAAVMQNGEANKKILLFFLQTIRRLIQVFGDVIELPCYKMSEAIEGVRLLCVHGLITLLQFTNLLFRSQGTQCF